MGTSTSAEAREYFSDLPKHLIPFYWKDEHDGDCIDMAFNKTRVQNRKDWLLKFGAQARAKAEGEVVDDDTAVTRADPAALISTSDLAASDGAVSYQDFINDELVQFSLVDLHRSIPSVVDGEFHSPALAGTCGGLPTMTPMLCNTGLKPSQRKVLFSCFKRRLTDEMKVAQLAGYCSEHAGYHHGEMSLHSTIVGMAQVSATFVTLDSGANLTFV